MGEQTFFRKKLCMGEQTFGHIYWGMFHMGTNDQIMQGSEKLTVQ